MLRKYNLFNQDIAFDPSKQRKYKLIPIFGICGFLDGDY